MARLLPTLGCCAVIARSRTWPTRRNLGVRVSTDRWWIMKKTVQTLFAVFIAVVALVGAAHPGPMSRGDYGTATSIYRMLADQGGPYAQRALGLMYDMARGVPQDYVEAMRWYRRAADQGDALAQRPLALQPRGRAAELYIGAHVAQPRCGQRIGQGGSRLCGSQPRTWCEQNDPGGNH
jgi:hypothetical protein